MPSTYTARNRLEKQAPGENANTWGANLNSNVFDLADFALDGMTSFDLSTTKTLTDEDGAADEARARYINITGGSGGTVTIPNVEKVYLVRNASSGTVTFTTGSGTTAAVAAGVNTIIACEGSNVVRNLFSGSMAAQDANAVAITGGTISGTVLAWEDRASAYTFASTDIGTIVFGGSSGARVFTIPTNASVPFPVGVVIHVIQRDTGSMVLTPASGVTLLFNGGSVASATVSYGGGGQLVKVDTNTWMVYGSGIA